MRNMNTLKTIGASAAAAMAVSFAAAAPANAQSYGGGSDPLMGAILRGVLGAVVGQNNDYGYGQGTYRSPDCQYYRDGRCYRNVGHWEREHGINSRTGAYGSGGGYGYGYGDPYGGGYGFQEGRTYSGRGYYREGRFWRNHGEWRSYQNQRGRDYRYDRRW